MTEATTPEGCTCVVAFGQDSKCLRHGIGTAWRASHPEADLRNRPAGAGYTPRQLSTIPDDALGIERHLIAGVPVVPEGIVLVPREPTEAMLKAGGVFLDSDAYALCRSKSETTARFWSAMLAAAQPAGDRGEREGG